MSTRRERAAKRARWVRDAKGIPRPLCPNGCGEPGSHFFPPSLGDPGFYICQPRPAQETR